jgi:hypothetical protein
MLGKKRKQDVSHPEPDLSAGSGHWKKDLYQEKRPFHRNGSCNVTQEILYPQANLHFTRAANRSAQSRDDFIAEPFAATCYSASLTIKHVMHRLFATKGE